MLPQNPPTSWDMIIVTIVLLAAWLGAVVALGTLAETPDDRGGKPG